MKYSSHPLLIFTVNTTSLDWSHFKVIYPTYLDATKTYKQGRRISKETSIASPNVQEISDALKHLKLRHVVQPYKKLSRDVESQWHNTGRVLVDMSEISALTTKKALCKEIAGIIPKLGCRVRRMEEEEQQRKLKEEEERAKAEAAKAAAAAAKSGGQGSAFAGSGAGKKSQKKKGKKKR